MKEETMKIDDIKTVAVTGAGDMGHGIAEVALIAGYKVFSGISSKSSLTEVFHGFMKALPNLSARERCHRIIMKRSKVNY